MTLGVYRYHLNCGRMGKLEGVFLATAEDITRLREKGSVAVSEVLGKHSEIDAPTGSDNLWLITEDANAVSVVVSFLLTSGFNPLEWVEYDD